MPVVPAGLGGAEGKAYGWKIALYEMTEELGRGTVA